MENAYQADPELAAMRLDFAADRREVLEVLTSGFLVHGGADERGR